VRPRLSGTLLLAVLIACSCGAPSSTGTDWSQQSSASAGGGMNALIKAAKREGTLTVPSPPDRWPGYAALVQGFESRYGIKVSSVDVKGDAGQLQRAGSLDVFELAADTASAQTSEFAPYLAFYWLEIPSTLKNPKAYWYSGCGGDMTIGYDAMTLPSITSVSDLVKPEFRVGLDGDPTYSNDAIAAVAAVSLASGGSPGDVRQGVDLFERLHSAGNLVGPNQTPAPVLFDWDYAQPPGYSRFKPQATVAAYDAEAVNRHASHPAAARLWEEFLFSDTGQNLCLQHGARPARMDAMRADGVLDLAAAQQLGPPPAAAVMLTPQQMASARAYLATHWAAAVSG
jgi:putative spermidine/putrescine transport system substrate-binding protein